MKKFKPLYTFASLWKQFVMFTKNWRRKSTGELVNKDTLELGDVTANDIEVRDIKCRKVTATGEIKTSSKITATGVVKGSSFDGDTSFETIKDRDGHLRFVEGDVTINTSVVGLEKIYGKWSLSGTHLMIVLCVSVDNAVELISGEVLGELTIPSWIGSKILPVAQQRIENKQFLMFDNPITNTQTLNTFFNKTSDTKLVINNAPLTLSAKRYCRLQYDILIDNAESE